MIDWARVESVIFDLGRVLITVDFTRGLFKYYQRDTISTDAEILESLFKDPVFVDFNTGKISAIQVHRQLTEKYQLPISYDQFVHEWCDIFSLMAGMDDFVARVGKHYKIGLLSDIDPLHWAYCRQNFPVLDLFEKPGLSFEIGALKPDPRCFLTAAANMGSDPKNCLFIDDREINVAGAEKAGMQAIQFTNIKDLIKIFSASKLRS